MKLRWEKLTGQYQNGEACFLGRIRVGSAYYSSTRSKDDPLRYMAATELPNLKPTHSPEPFASLEEAKARVEKAVASWLKLAGLKEAGEP